ncbi:MAG: hypothetical protein DMG65_23735 [Candidatus Angelobacter sp. Gp1-AA117]|nr:MAG: hypothetical protein DMG65_23735 [Candidatus Angelobacter sp. Gp1-AA117]
MKGDFTRWSFKPQNHYHSVLKQQGRVDLDADWNEQGAIDHHRTETEALDVIGQCGAPADNAGFMLTTAAGGKGLQVSKGRAYVDGILCENEADLPVTSQPDLPGFKLPTVPGVYIAYLRVWLRHITTVEDDLIRESALSGPDTCTRARTVWQVDFLPAGAVGASVNCATSLPAWDSLIGASTGKMMAQAAPFDTAQTPCTIPAKAGFRRLENQLYRVEVHDAGDAAKATFKWSRDNGSVVTSWMDQKTDPNLTVSNTGRDSVLGFAPGQWVELSDDTSDLNLKSGTLVPLTNVQDQTLVIDPAQAIPAGSAKIANFTINRKVRRWDSIGVISMTPGKFQDLEDGVQVQFAAGTYATGDYWMVPARTLKADVEWPLDGSSPVAQPPLGIRRHYCRLAIVQFDGTNWAVQGTCLPTFPPLTGITSGQDKGVHITNVRLIKPDNPLLNDTDVLVTDLLGAGIRVLCDGALNAVSVQPETCFLTLELPWPFFDPRQDSNAIIGYEYLVLPGDVQTAVGSAGGEITWRLKGSSAITAVGGSPTLAFVLNLLSRLQNAQQKVRILARFTLKGNYIWSQADPNVYLDGEGFGVEQKSGSNPSIGVRLPQSGDGRRGGDFEMWFFLALPVTLSGLAIAPPSVNIGQNATGTVTLTSAAPAGGAVVNLTSIVLDAAGAQLPGSTIATVPASVTVPAGQNSATFPITNTTLPPNAGGPLTLQVTASFAGKTAQANLSIGRAITLTNLVLNPVTILGGPSSVVTGTVTLSGPAPAAGAIVALASNNPNAARPQTPTVTVPANQTSANFAITTTGQAINAAVAVQITATFAGGSHSAQMTVLGQRLA